MFRYSASSYLFNSFLWCDVFTVNLDFPLNISPKLPITFSPQPPVHSSHKTILQWNFVYRKTTKFPILHNNQIWNTFILIGDTSLHKKWVHFWNTPFNPPTACSHAHTPDLVTADEDVKMTHLMYPLWLWPILSGVYSQRKEYVPYENGNFRISSRG